jgi:hypothetical protein
VHVKGFITRAAAVAVIASVALGATGAPCAAAEKTPPQKKPTASLTRLSPATQAILVAPAPVLAQQTGDKAASPGGFFRSKRGAVALVLMGAGAGFTLWSISHDRKPVRSPIR